MNQKTEQVTHIHNLLVEEYGEPSPGDYDPVDTLVSTIISQNTNDTNRDTAFDRLRERFPTWQAVRDAPTGAVEEAIRPAGLAPTKAPRIQQALWHITAEAGHLSLDFLADMPVEEARDWLLNIKGVGPKTAAIVMLFALGMPAFPVDTHVHRVTRRLGLIPEDASREKAHDLLEDDTPEEIYYPFHINLITHGRQVCHARTPECGRCVLQDACAYYASQFEGE